MATQKKNTKPAGAKKSVRDLKPTKDAKGGARHAEGNRTSGRTQENLVNRKTYLQ
jgi:hypothetical protein